MLAAIKIVSLQFIRFKHLCNYYGIICPYNKICVNLHIIEYTTYAS